MSYEILLIKATQDDYNKLDGTIKKQAKAQLLKLTVSPELGQPLGKKMGLDLTGYCSLHFYGNKYRIVYKVDEGKKQVVVVGIGLREKARVYEAATHRLGRE